MLDEDKKLDQETSPEEESLLGGIDLSSPSQIEDPPIEDTEKKSENPAPADEGPPKNTAQADQAASPEHPVEQPTLAARSDTTMATIVELPELKKLEYEELSGMYISTLSIVPPGRKLLVTHGIVQSSVLLQARRVQELRLQKGMNEAIGQLKEEASALSCNAILGIQISVIPLGQLYPDSVWITACGTACVLDHRKKRKPQTPSEPFNPESSEEK